MTEAAIAGAATKDATIREIAGEAFTAFNSDGRYVLLEHVFFSRPAGDARR
jgi:hypothetical protein